MSVSSSSAEHGKDRHATETKSLLPQHTRPRNNIIHSPRKPTRHHQHQHQPQPLFPDESPQPHHLPQPLHRRCRLLITILFALSTLLALLSLSVKFIHLILPTPTPTVTLLSLSLSLSPSIASLRASLSNPSLASSFRFSDSAYTLHYNSKPVSETNPNVFLHIPPQRSVEIAYDMLFEKTDETRRGLEEMLYRAGRGETVLLDVTVYLYGSSAIRPWSVTMVALFYDCIGIAVDFSGKAATGGACKLVEKLTS